MQKTILHRHLHTSHRVELCAIFGAIMSVGKRIQQLRGQESRESFGLRFGKNRNTILRYEQGDGQPTADFIVAICREYEINANWLLTGEGPMKLEGWRLEAQEDMLKDVFLDDKEAARRREAKMKECGESLRQSRAAAEEVAGRIVADLGLDESKKEYLRHTLQAIPVPPAVRESTIDYGQRVTDLDLTKGVALLAKIYGSGDQVLIRAIVANLSAFSESIDNKARAIEAEGRMSQMENRLKALEKQLAELLGARGNEKAAGNRQ